MNYLTGYDGWSFYTPQCAVVPLDGDAAAGHAPDGRQRRAADDVPRRRATSSASPTTTSSSATGTRWTGSPTSSSGAACCGRHLGLELDAYFFTPRAYEALRARARDVAFADAQELVNWVRAVKSPAEIALMREAARIAERVMAPAIDAVEPGVRQCDAVAAIYDAQVRGADGGRRRLSRDRADAPDRPGHLDAAPDLERRPVRERRGDDPRACGLRPALPLPDRAHRVPRRAAAQADRDGRGHRRGPGGRARRGAARAPPASEVEAAWREHIARHGLEKASRIGYSVGARLSARLGRAHDEPAPGRHDAAGAGHGLPHDLGMWMDDWGFEASETFLVTETGAECLVLVPARARGQGVRWPSMRIAHSA